MAAFVPGAGLPLSSSRTFLSGSQSLLSTSTKPQNEATYPTEISALQLPKLPELPKIPFLKPKEKKPEEKPAPVKTVKANKKVLSNVVVTSQPKKAPPAKKKAVLKRGLPKFYNPTTSRAEFRATAKGQNATAFDVRVGREKNTTNRRINEQGTFRNMDPYTEELLWARKGWSSDEAKVGVRTAIKNILGNAHLFESEVAELAPSISCVTQTANMKEFVRAIGLSAAYRTRFFESSSNNRFIELNFLHFLGRAPRSQEEISEHIKIINEQGYNAEINSYIDSDEYDTLWGESRIPAVNFRGGHPYNNDMNKLAVLNGGYSSTDQVYKQALFATGDDASWQASTILKGLPEAWRGENAARDRAGVVYEFPSEAFWNPRPPGLRQAEVAWKLRYGNWNKFWYKDSAVYQDIMKPKMTESEEEKAEAEAILKYGSTVAKNYIGAKKVFDKAPVIEIQSGLVSVQMKEITFPIPADLKQPL